MVDKTIYKLDQDISKLFKFYKEVANLERIWDFDKKDLESLRNFLINMDKIPLFLFEDPKYNIVIKNKKDFKKIISLIDFLLN